METLIYIWDNIFYKPLFNLLVILYSWNDFYSLGLAIIFLTIFLRIFLLPLSVISLRNKSRYLKLNRKIAEIKKDHLHDPELAKEEIRKEMKRHKIRPWAKALSLGVQAFVLVLLYQVFMGGINTKLDDLYSWVYHPDYINTVFLGIDLKGHNMFLPIVVGSLLFVEIVIAQRKNNQLFSVGDLLYRYLFPVFSVVALYILPAVKALFILTSMIFTIIVGLVFKIFSKPTRESG